MEYRDGLDDKAFHVDGFYDPSFEVTGEDEEILLDENEEAKAHAHYVVGCVAISPSHQLMAYTVDTSGYETYDLRIVRLDTAKKANHELVDEIKNIDGHVTWGKDDDTIFYCKLDDAHRPYQVYRHTVAESADNDDVKLFEESDERICACSEDLGRRTACGRARASPMASLERADRIRARKAARTSTVAE